MTFGAVAYGTGPYGAGEGAAVAAGAFPDVAVYLEMATGVLVDVSTDFRAIDINRGKGRELDRFQVGTATVRLLDTSRKYDPSNAASPYYPYLVPMKALRIQATWAGVTYPLYSGFLDSIDNFYAGPPNGYAETELRAVDGFAVLASADLATSAYAQEVEADGPVAWWRLGDPDSSTQAVDSIGDADLTRTGSGVELGQPSLVSRESNGAAQFLNDATGEEDGFQRFGPALVTTAPLTLELVYAFVGPGTDGLLAGHISGFGGAGFVMGTNGTDVQFAVSTGAGATTVVTATVASLNDGAPHHLVGVWEAGGTVRLYADGTQVQTGSRTVAALPATAWVNIGGADWAPDETMDCVLDEVAIYGSALSAARVAAHHEAVATPWSGDLPGERLDRVLDAAEWPETGRELDSGTTVLASADLASTSALEHAQKVAETDWGALFMAADGRVRFIGRDNLWNPEELGAFGDDKTDPTELGYRELRPEFSAETIRNDVTVSRIEGVAQRVTDATSIAAYKRRSFSVDGLLHASDALSRSAAEFLVSEYKDPRRRIAALVISPRGNPNRVGDRAADLFPQVLARELMDMIQVEDRPPGGGALNNQDSTIQGISHQIGPMEWVTSWYLSPAFGSAGLGGVGVWDETSWDQARFAF